MFFFFFSVCLMHIYDVIWFANLYDIVFSVYSINYNVSLIHILEIN